MSEMYIKTICSGVRVMRVSQDGVGKMPIEKPYLGNVVFICDLQKARVMPNLMLWREAIRQHRLMGMAGD